jgi:glucosylceramidase
LFCSYVIEKSSHPSLTNLCLVLSISQAEWIFDTITGEISTTAIPEGELCLTTGWPFLQVGAFDTSYAGSSGKTVVVLNEAAETANFVLKNEGEIVMSSSIPPRSIQTVLFD